MGCSRRIERQKRETISSADCMSSKGAKSDGKRSLLLTHGSFNSLHYNYDSIVLCLMMQGLECPLSSFARERRVSMSPPKTSMSICHMSALIQMMKGSPHKLTWHRETLMPCLAPPRYEAGRARRLRPWHHGACICCRQVLQADGRQHCAACNTRSLEGGRGVEHPSPCIGLTVRTKRITSLNISDI